MIDEERISEARNLASDDIQMHIEEEGSPKLPLHAVATWQPEACVTP